MRIMIFNASASIIFGTTFGTRKLFSKKYTHAEVVIIQQLPYVIHTYFSFKIPNLRHKTTKMPKIRHYYNIWRHTKSAAELAASAKNIFISIHRSSRAIKHKSAAAKLTFAATFCSIIIQAHIKWDLYTN